MNPPPLPGKHPVLCLDCCTLTCGVPEHRHVSHPELLTLSIAHIDCDAFYASVEKRDRPDLRDTPVLVGGGRRGVVTTACYVARRYGCRSAMPMFKALALCPQAVIIRPDFTKYAAMARRLRLMMTDLTPAVQPLSIDEAVLDLSGTEALHRAPPALMLARLAQRVELECGIPISIGLAANRMRAKIAADRGKPRGFYVLGIEAPQALAAEPAAILPGIGPVQGRRLAARNLRTVADLQQSTDPDLRRLAWLEDPRPVREEDRTRSVSAETTFDTDLADFPALEARLWHVTNRLADRLREKDLAAAGVTLKLKTASFASRTRSVRLPRPSRLPDTLFAAAKTLLARETDGTRFRLIGIAATPLAEGQDADQTDLADPTLQRRVARQKALDTLRARFGSDAVVSGRAIK